MATSIPGIIIRDLDHPSAPISPVIQLDYNILLTQVVTNANLFAWLARVPTQYPGATYHAINRQVRREAILAQENHENVITCQSVSTHSLQVRTFNVSTFLTS